MDGPGASRRTILRSGILAVGALAGVVGLAGVAEKLRSGPQLAAEGATNITLHGTDWHLSAPGLRRGDLPKRGDRVSVTGSLSYTAEGEGMGAFVASVLHVDAPGHGPYSQVQLETHNFQLPDGTLVGMGSTSAQGESVFAIVGGTGRFLGVTGSYVARQSPFETGGNGTAEFTLTLHSGR
jgi:hypothetical protein